MRLARVIALTAALLGAFSVCAHANLLTNPGFETGDFTGWTLSGNTGFTGVSTGTAHSGTFAAFLGAVGSLDFLSQTVPTTPGQSYAISFWLLSDGGTPNEFDVEFGGVTLFDQHNIPQQGYTLHTVVGTATAATTVVAFSSRDDPGFLWLDDTTVDPVGRVPAPMTLLLVGAGLAVTATLRRRRRSA
jgi:hypothetical protein